MSQSGSRKLYPQYFVHYISLSLKQNKTEKIASEKFIQPVTERCDFLCVCDTGICMHPFFLPDLFQISRCCLENRLSLIHAGFPPSIKGGCIQDREIKSADNLLVSAWLCHSNYYRAKSSFR